MKTILLLITLCLPVYMSAQFSVELEGRIKEKIQYNKVPVNTEIKLVGFKSVNTYEKGIIQVDGEDIDITYDDLKNIDFNIKNLDDFWTVKKIHFDTYENFLEKGYQYNLRKEIDEDVIDYLNYLESNNFIFHDSYLEDYLYQLIYKIHPFQLNDGRAGNLSINVLKSIEPNAFVYPNGFMFISTGLLSIINSEEELLSILAHEISHFVLDHSIVNINEAEKREKRAGFWAGLLTGIGALADVGVSSRNEYYTPGTITLATAEIAYSIASAVNQRLGMEFSKNQELIADKCAKDLMQHIQKDPNSLSSSLQKIKEYCIRTGNYYAIDESGTHPAIDERIEKLGFPSIIKDYEYDKKISFVHTINAIMEYNSMHLGMSEELVRKNITNNVATEEDYILLAMVILKTHNSESKNLEALGLIEMAKSLNVTPQLEAYKQEALVLLRLNRKNEAVKSLENYKSALKSKSEDLDKISNSDLWLAYFEYLNDEIEWSTKMAHKIGKL
ncbi:MAG: M48 family metallopeptidase [Chitinophagales bacterium]